MKPRNRGTTRATWVCCSMVSDTSTAHGSRVRRHGRSRRTCSPQASAATWSAVERDAQAQTSCPSYGRRRAGACAAFHIITLRRKKHTS